MAARSRCAPIVALWISCSDVIGRTAMPSLVDEEGVFVCPVAGAAVFHDPQPPRGHLIDDASDRGR